MFCCSPNQMSCTEEQSNAVNMFLLLFLRALRLIVIFLKRMDESELHHSNLVTGSTGGTPNWSSSSKCNQRGWILLSTVLLYLGYWRQRPETCLFNETKSVVLAHVDTAAAGRLDFPEDMKTAFYIILPTCTVSCIWSECRGNNSVTCKHWI